MLAYKKEGNGKIVLLLHAFPHSSKMWEAQAAALKSQYTVLMPDLPGFGKSPAQKNCTMASMAKNVAELLDSLKIQGPVFLAGLSMGGYVAFEFLDQFPQRVAGLGFFATRPGADSEEAKGNRYKAVEAMEKFGMEPFAKKAVKSQLGKTTQEKNPALVSEVLGWMLECSAESAIEATRGMAERRDLTSVLSKIKVPALIIGGVEDPLISPDIIKQMNGQIAGSEMHLLPECGHLVNKEKPEEFQKLFSAFLKAKY